MSKEKYSSTAIMLVVIAVSILLMVVIVPFSMSGKGARSSADTSDADLRIQPLARVALQQAAPAGASGPRDGATVYNSVCMACHAAGVAGAPKAGDKAAWAPRIAKGNEALIKSVTNGLGAMPPKGGGADLTADELKDAVAHLVGLAK